MPTTTDLDAGEALVKLSSPARPNWRLVACPPAGAGAGFYRPLVDHCRSAGVELWSVRYPARESRLAQPHPGSVAVMATEVATALRSSATLPTVLLGHSMGALVAVRTAKLLAAEQLPVIDLLALSAHEAPGEWPWSRLSRYRRARLAEVMTDGARLREWVARNGDVPEILLQDNGFWAMQLPILRQDLQACLDDDLALARCSSRDSTVAPVLDVPMVLLCGDRDPLVRLPQMHPWALLTSSRVSRHLLQGEHHAVTSDGAAAVRVLAQAVASERLSAEAV